MFKNRAFHLVALGVATLFAFLVADPPNTGESAGWLEPSLARIIFFHLPSAWITSILIFVAAYLGFRYLKSRERSFDIKLGAVLELAGYMGVATMLTGILFSRMQWNAWWQWDPRQTSFLLVLLLVGAALALRAGLKDDEKRANASAGYAVMLALPAAFLIFVYPRLDSVQTFHPSMTSAGDRAELFSPMYSVGLLLMMIGLGLTCLALYRDRVKAEQLNFEWEAAHGDRWGEADRGGTAADRVVRPVAVSSKNVD